MQIVDVPSRTAAVVQQTIPMTQIPEAQRRARRAVEALVKSGSIVPASPPLTIWRAAGGGKIDYAPGLFVETPFDESGEVSSFEMPAGRAAHIVLEGPYEQLGAAWQQMFAACERQAIKLGSWNWEVYSESAAPHPRTELYALLA